MTTSCLWNATKPPNKASIGPNTVNVLLLLTTNMGMGKARNISDKISIMQYI